MIKTYKIMLIPNKKQNTKLFHYADAARFAYNWALEKEMIAFQKGEGFLSDGILRKEFTQFKKTEEGAWLNQISNNVMKQAIKDCCEAFGNFFREYQKTGVQYSQKKKEHFARIGRTLTVYDRKGHPKFKSRKHSISKFYQDNVKIKFTDTHMKVEEADKKTVPKKEGIGIDLGVKELAVCSDEKRYKNINKTRRMKQLEKKKRRIQRGIARKYEKNKRGESYWKTKNLKKSEQKLLKINHGLTNIRQNYIHQITSEVMKREPSFICMEDLNVKGMMKNRHLSKVIQEQSFYEFRRQVSYKGEWNGIKVIFADRYFPSSKKCICCGHIKKNLKLSERIYQCECGNKIDRDYQAALNLKWYGENMLKSVS